MEVLIIILIVTLIVQTCYKIYLNFADHTRDRQLAALTEQFKNAHADFAHEKQRLQRIIDDRDASIRAVMAQRNILSAECEQLRNALAWRPDTDQIKSVYNAIGVMDQANEHTDAKNLTSLWESLKNVDMCYRTDLTDKTTR